MTRDDIPKSLSRVLAETPELRQSFIVGGSVRDRRLGFTPKDFDVEVFGVGYEEVTVALARWGRVDTVGKSFGVVKLTTQEHTFDFSLPRLDSKIAVGHQGFKVETDGDLTLREAAARRDFTINALAYDPRTEAVADNFGGLSDLRWRVLRHVGPAFADDPLRVLRGMQFASRFDLTPAVETLVVCRAIKGSFKELSVERVWGEWFKWAAQSTVPSRGLDFLLASGWIENFPELHKLFGCRQDPEWHPEGDAFNHTLHCCDALAKMPAWRQREPAERAMLMLGVLCHDFGKPDTTTTAVKDGVERVISPGHDAVGADIAERFLDRIGAPEIVRRQVPPLVLNHMAHLQTTSKRSVRRLALRMAPSTIDHLVMVMEADHSGRPPLQAGMPPAAAELAAMAVEMNVQLDVPKPILMGRHLIELGFEPGPGMGKILKAAFEAQLDGVFETIEGALLFVSENNA